MTLKTTVRNYGLDLLRCIAMFLIVVLHVMSVGALWDGKRCTGEWLGVNALFAISRCAVNIYALLSGYCGYGRNHGMEKLFHLWSGVFFWGLWGYLVFDAIEGHFSTRHLLHGAMPITFCNYWYFTAYCLLYPLMPWLDKEIEKATPRHLAFMLSFFGISFCIMPLVCQNILPQVGFVLRPATGSFVWLGYLYCLGAVMHRFHLAKIIPAFGWMTSLLFCWGILIVSTPLVSRAFRWQFLCCHYSPLCLGVAMSLLALFSRFSIGFSGVTQMSSCTFGVYIIHFHPKIMGLLYGRLQYNNSPSMLIVQTLIMSLLIYLSCTLLEWGRNAFMHKVSFWTYQHSK